jgi:transcriptional regulator
VHPNRTFGWDDPAAMLEMVGRVAFTRIVAATDQGLRVAHVPVLVCDGPALRFHLANGNALTRQLDGRVALALTEGPNAYVSANWYVDVRGAVPTWNYLAVECEGPVRQLDRAALVKLLDALSATLEPTVGEDWTRAKMEPPRFDAMLNAITAFELRIDALRGTRKVSQNKSDEEAAGVLRGMEANGANAMAAAIRQARA